LEDFLKTENKAPKTITRYCGVFRKFTEFIQSVEPYLKHLDQIDPQLLERYKDFRRRERISPNGHPDTPSRNGVTPRTLNNELMFLRTIFNLAKRRGFVQKNPLDDVKPIDGRKRKKYEPLTQKQWAQLLDAADEAFRPIVLTFLLTGMRAGELRHLEWTDIDFERDEIHIRAKQEWTPKDKEDRTVHLHNRLKGVLKKWKQNSNTRYVFGDGDSPCPDKLLPRLHRTCKRAGLPNLKVHDLRDEFASHLLMSGVGIETVSKLLGHSDIQITWNHYVHLAPQKLKEAVERLEFTW